MAGRTLSRTIVCFAAAAAAAALPACGGDDPTPPDRTERFEQTPLREPGESGTVKETVCKRVPPRAVARALRKPDLRLVAMPNDSLDLSVCDWRGGRIRVQMILDSAPRAQLRFFNQLSEQLQFYNDDPKRRPYQIKRVGDDAAYGGAGAWWTRTKSQLVAYSRNRILRIRVVGMKAKRQAAVRLGRLGFRRISAPGS
jgi:hypothetical protein